MSTKGKEIQLGKLKIQIDPVVLAHRIAQRQLPLLILVAFLGGISTVGVYLATPKRYEAKSKILIRYESYQESYLRKLLNVAAGYLGSNAEMMLILNELDLYPKMRATLPYEIALRRLRSELRVAPDIKHITVRFVSEDPRQAQRIVAFTTERILRKIAALNEAPYDRQLDAIDRTLRETEPKKRQAEKQLFAFKAANPDIATQVSGLLVGADAPLTAIGDQIRRAEQDLLDARTGVVSRPSRRSRETEATKALGEIVARRDAALARYTHSHPEVVRLTAAVNQARARVDSETLATEGRAATSSNPAERRKRIERARAHLQRLLKRKVELEQRVIAKPDLQREWAELSMTASAMASEYRGLMERRSKVRNDRLLAANNLQENFRLVDKARIPEIPKEPQRSRFMGIGMFLTALFGLGLALVLEATRQTFAHPKELATQNRLEVLAALPQIVRK